MRDLSAISSLITQQYATTPIIQVEIEWANDSIDRFAKLFSTGIKPWLVSIGNLSSSRSQKTFSGIQYTSVVLKDLDGYLRNKNEEQILEGSKCRVYQTYDGTTSKVLIFEGKAEGPILWTEGSRELSFSIVSKADNLLVGTILDDAFITENLSEPRYDRKAIEDVMVPLTFGSVVNMKPIKITRQLEARLASDILINHPATVDPDNEDSEYFLFEALSDSDSPFYGYELNDISRVEIDGHILDVSYFGLSGNYHRFDILDNNPLKYNLGLATGERVIDDPDYENAKVLWLKYDGFNIENQCVSIAQANMFNQCQKQEGRKCYFYVPWSTRNTYSGQLPDGTTGNKQTRRALLIEGENTIAQVQTYKPTDNFQTYNDFHNEPITVLNKGSVIRLWLSGTYTRGLYPEIYLVNDGACTISSVRSRHSKTNLLEELPYDLVQGGFYTIIDFFGFKAIQTHIPLGDYGNAGYSDDIFVSLRSGTGVATIDGTTTSTDPWGNTSEIIRYLISVYGGGLTANTASFDAARTDVANYPMGFTLRDQKNLFELVGDIAFQGRCALRLNNSDFTIIYLAKVPTPVDTIDDDTVLTRTMKVTQIPISEIVTKLVYTFRRAGNLDEEKFILYKNYEEFGHQSTSINFWTYNQKDCVTISAQFWSNRYGRLWRRYEFSMLPKAIAFEVFDPLTVDLDGIIGRFTNVTSDIIGETLAINYNPETKEVLVNIEVASDLGTTEQQDDYWTVASLSRPDNPCSLDKKGYFTIELPDFPTAHRLHTHSDVNLTRRQDEFDEDVTNTDNDLQDGDLLIRKDNEWIPVNKSVLTTNGSGGGGGGDTVEVPTIVVSHTNAYFNQ